MAVDVDVRTLFIGNLHKNVTEDILYELFLQAGPIDRVSILPKNNCSGYGFVTYKHESSIDYAIELFRGTALFKSELIIRKRIPKQTNDMKGFYSQDQLHSLQLVSQNLNQNLHIVDFSLNSSWGSRSNRSKPYDIDSRNHMPRPRDRNQDKNRNHGNKQYHRRKGRRRD